MNLNVFIILFFTLFAGGHSLKCYECTSATGSCVNVQATCPENSTTCASATTVTTIGNITSTTPFKRCFWPQNCLNGSFNFGVLRSATAMQCCNTELCNSQEVPDASSNSPNGKQCYYCDGISCLNKLKCLGTQDYCIKAKYEPNITSLPSTVKGCVSKSICDIASQTPQGLLDFSCCPGNLCNSATSITQNLLILLSLLWPFICYIMLH